MPVQVEFKSLALKVECDHGALLSEVARGAGVGLLSVCGNRGLCGRCRIKILSGEVSPLTKVERELLSTSEIAEGYRLACQTRVLGNLTAAIPSISLLVDQRMQLAGMEVKVSLDPPVKECVVEMDLPDMDDSRSVWDKLVGTLKKTYGLAVTTADLIVMRRLPLILHECRGKVRVSVRAQEVIDVRPPDAIPLGLAIDLGTTKIGGYLVNLETGEILAVEGMMNPQRAYGEDVMSRITYAMENGGGELHRVVIEGLNKLIRKLCPEPERIEEVTLVANTAIHHLLLELPVRQLGLAPYIPAVKNALDLKARNLGLNSAPGAYVHLLPHVAGFIGADHVAVILATGIHKTDKTVIGLDIGTNTEIVLVHKGKMKSTSCASGPAFEGGHITHGVGAIEGAIEKVKLKGSAVEFQTINDTPPIGLCGSGILDVAAELCRVGLINARGQLQSGTGVRQVGTTREFVLVTGESGSGEDITITQSDISEIQLAKAAIRTGIETLLDEMGIGWGEVEEVIIAGGFGTSLSPASGLAIGMFPPLTLERFKPVGNAAGIGCTLCLTSMHQRSEAKEIARQVSYVELMTHPQFHTRFAWAMYFPEQSHTTQED